MKPKHAYDLIVIGGGSAGHAAAAKASSLGLSTALIESASELGGLCILRGCMPSKALIETANRARAIREASRFGIRVGKPEIDLPALRARVRHLVKDFQKAREEAMTDSTYQLHRASARFLDPHTLELTDAEKQATRLTAKTFIIATGSSPAIPEIDGLNATPYWTSDDLPQLPEIPRRIAILGSGAIGMECAHLFEGLGSEVHVILRGDRILSSHDPDLAEALERESEERGIHFHQNTRLESISHDGTRFTLHAENGSNIPEAEALLVATGRKPNTSELGLDTIHLAHDKGRILMDTRCVTSLPHIFAAGDCASPVGVVHLAVIQGEAAATQAAKHILDGYTQTALEWDPESAMAGWFTEPQSVEIGISENKAREKGLRVRIGKEHYNDHGKGMIAGSKHGFVKVIADENDRLIGAVAVGPEVVETSHLLQFAIAQKMTAAEYLSLPHYHPTFAEAWSRAVKNLPAT
ncbi:MAG: NAD(P)/FAD-dependent oxidoreductase [Luteolibacter sp.]